MALWHAAHSILTSYIPWNTSSPVSPLGVPDQTTPSVSSHPPSLSFTRPPQGLISRHQWLQLSISQSLSLSELFHPASLLLASAQIVPAVWSLQGRRTTPTRTLINLAEREPSALSMRDMGGKEKKVLMITNAPNYQG